MKRTSEPTPKQVEYASRIALLTPERMPDEIGRTVLMLFDQLVARGVGPEKAAYTVALVYFVAWNKPGKESANV